jgi:serine/threonine protein kinase
MEPGNCNANYFKCESKYEYGCCHELWRCVQVLGQVLKALIALHGAGYAHCNIKPSNILHLAKQHDWVLSDFASSRPQSALPCFPPPSFILLYSCFG